MATLKSEKMELFAQARARGLSLTASAREAGYSDGTCHVRGSELGKNPAILARVAELRTKLDDRLVEVVTADRETILRNISELVVEAREARDRSTALKGLELLGKSIGLFQEKAPEAKSPLDGMTPRELKELIASIDRYEEALMAAPPAELRLVANAPADDDEAAA